MAKIWKKNEIVVAGFYRRTEKREITLHDATMKMVAYFMSLGDTQEDAETKVSDFSTESAAFLYVYTLGNKTPLIAAINNTTLPYMDAAAKAFLIDCLSPTV